MMKEITSDWLQSARSDLSIIEHIINDESLTHQTAFHAQQAIEKCFKAIIEEKQLGFIKTHSLITLLGIIENHIVLTLNLDNLLILDKLYIDSRYPGDLGLLPEGKPTINDAKEFQKEAQNIYNQIISNIN